MSDERMPPQDPRVEAFLASLAEVGAPADLASAASARVRAKPGRRPSFRLPLLAAAAGLLVVMAGAMAAGWQPPFDLRLGQQPTGAPSSPLASLEASPPPETWEFAMIVQDPVVVRSGPDGAGDDLGPRPGNDGTIVLVRERRTVNGRTWIRIEEGFGGAERFVWVPETVPSVGPAGYIVPVLQRTTFLGCHTGEPPTIDSLSGSSSPQRLACYGPASFTIGPVRAVPIWDDTASSGTPAWLAGPATMTLEGPVTADGIVPLVPVRVDPALGIDLPQDRWLRVTVHLDDPAAATCVRETRFADRPVGEPSDQVLWCRQQVVVTGYDEVVGPSPIPAP